ncbi:MAG: hypothetical protein AB4062_16820, partial [Crocosphaera sp.]
VIEVAPFPITKEAASDIVGNSEIIDNIANKGGLIEVKAKLKTNSNNFSSYEWSSSSGPQQKMTQGTTTTAKVNIEKRRPLTFVLPILREWSGIY